MYSCSCNLATSGLLEKWISEERFAAIEFGKSEDGSITANGIPPHVMILKKLEVLENALTTSTQRPTLDLHPLSNLSPQPSSNTAYQHIINCPIFI